MKLPHSYSTATDPSVDERIAGQARRKIESSHIRRWSDQLQVCCQDGTVILTGQLPSFYLKQILQTIVRKLPGVQAIDNLVQVTSVPAEMDRHMRSD